MSSSSNAQTGGSLSSDWEQREFVQNIQYNLIKIADFINRFDLSCRSKLALLDERMSKLERSLDLLEAASRKHVNGEFQ